MTEVIAIIALAGLLAYREYQHDKQVRDLILQIRSKDLREYAEAKSYVEPPKEKPKELEKLTNFEDLNPEDAIKVLQENLSRPDVMEE